MGLSLSIRDLRVETARSRCLLQISALDVAAGEAVVIAGPSGAGKSTLLYACAGLISPASGQVLWSGQDIAQLDDRARTAFRRKNIGFIFQDHLLLEELDALGNAALCAAYAPKAERAQLRTSAAGLLTRLGLGTQQTARTAVMSGGERQRIAVARALAGDPAIILADEPTAALDRSAADALAEDLFALASEQGRTVVIISHDTALHDRADRVIRISDGTLAPC